MQKHLKGTLAVILAIVLIAVAVPFGAFARTVETAPLTIGVMSDTHYYPRSLMPAEDDEQGWEAFSEFCRVKGKQFPQTGGLVDAALAAMAEDVREKGLKYVLIPGDLTKDSEIEAHKGLAAKLEQFEKDTGAQVLVINGNHDINNYDAASFTTGKEVKDKSLVTTPEQFKEIYKNLGYDLASAVYTPPKGKQANGLSYAVSLEGGYRLIVMDGGKYSPDNMEPGHSGGHETGGNFSDDFIEWVLGQCAEARAKGETIIGMTHFSLVPHLWLEATIAQDFCLDNYQNVAEALADAGMHYVFTGHMHQNDIAKAVSDNGETIYDIQTNSLSGYPNFFREAQFDNTKGEGQISVEINTYPVDRVQKVNTDPHNSAVVATPRPEDGNYRYELDGDTYPTYQDYSYAFSNCKGNSTDFVMTMASGFLASGLNTVTSAGGLMNLLKNNGIDLEEILKGFLGDGVSILGYDIFTVKNVMAFLEDLFGQIEDNYLKDPQKTMEILKGSIERLVDFKVADTPPSAEYAKRFHIGEGKSYGTLGDLVLCVMHSYTAGDEAGVAFKNGHYVADGEKPDQFVAEALEGFENGDSAQRLIDELIDILLNDLIQGEILTNLEFRLNALFPDGSFGSHTADALQMLLKLITQGDPNYKKIVDFTFKFLSGLNIIPYDSLNAILDHYIEEYLTDSQIESVGHEVAYIADDFFIDENPAVQMDSTATLVYRGKVPVEATADNYRRPSNVGMTFGVDAATTRNINWYTKCTVDGAKVLPYNTDIQIVPYSENPQFSDKLPAGVKVKTSEETVKLQFPGIDIGVFGLFPYYFDATRHMVEITGLKAGEKYCFRVGDAEKGWWSDTGVIETADNSNQLTFFHMSDSQSQSERQYSRSWAKVLDTAYTMYPDADFIMHTGDHVDKGDNANQWQWLFNTGADNLMKTVLMPTAGNHEAKSEFAIDQNFILSNVPEQDRTTGVYYSFDYNNAHFMVLNTNNLSEEKGLSKDQMEWLKKDAAQSDAQWKIVALHKAPYSNGSHFDDDDVIQLRKELSTLMPELGIDVVLQGHDHVYLRTGVMDNNEVVQTQTKTVTYNGRDYTAKLDPKGSIYVISGCSGVKTYVTKDPAETDQLFPRAEKLADATDPIFSAFQIDGDTLYFDAYTVGSDGAQRIDSFAIEKKTADVPETSTNAAKPEESTATPITTEPTKPDDTKQPTVTVPAGDVTDATPSVPDNTQQTTAPQTTAGDAENPLTGDNTSPLLIAVPVAALAALVLAETMRRKKARGER